ncbi:uncharacterized protein [Ptychodera flava]|uniref:uncharacterized protein n=1 Tax=Ptychodera flava TaxID=63121 RepID=UPI003969D048
MTIDADSFKITEPSPAEITYTRTDTTSVIFEMTISPYDTYSGQVDSVYVYFSDMNDKQSNAVAGTWAGGSLYVENPNTKLQDVSASLQLDDDCSDYTHLCVQIVEGETIKDEAYVVITSFTITEPSPDLIEYNRVTDETITFDVGVSSALNGGTVSGIDVFFEDDSGNLLGTAEQVDISPQVVLDPPDNSEADITDTVVNLKFYSRSDCEAADKLCVRITGTGIDKNNDKECKDLGKGQGQAGEKECSVVRIESESFKITSPSPAEIIYTKYDDTTITFNLEATAEVATATITGVNAYFTNNIDGDERVESTPVLAGGAAPTAETPITVDHDANDPTKIDGCEATLRLDSENCEAYTHLCISLIADIPVYEEECLPFGIEEDEAGQKSCESDVVITSFTITEPSPDLIEYNRVTDETITFDVGVSSALNGGTVSGIDVFFEDGIGTLIGTVKEATTQGDANLGKGGDSDKLSGNTVQLKFDSRADCESAEKVCVKITGSGIDTNNDKECKDFGSNQGQAGNKECAVMTIDADSFKVTEPPPDEVTYTMTDTTLVTFEIAISPYDTYSGQVDSVNVYFSDMNDKQTEAVAGTWEGGPLSVEKANTKLEDIAASLQLDDDCIDYTHLCVEIVEGETVKDEACIEEGTESTQAGRFDCSGSSGFHTDRSFTLFAFLIAVIMQLL